MVPIYSHCPNCSTQWSLVVLTAVPNAPICSTQLSPLQRPIVPTAVPNHLQCPKLPSAVPNGLNCSAQLHTICIAQCFNLN